ncbi:MAG: molybdopterin cofactor-binding domain-containing protein, partial [Anaerolineae bacterium]
ELAEWKHTAEGTSALADGTSAIYEHMQQSESIDFAVVDGVGIEGAPPERQPLAQHALRATYTRPFGMHGSLTPSAAVAHAAPDNSAMKLWVQTQGVFPQRDTIAPIIGLDPANLTVIHMEGAGCYGNNGADDCALDAALLAKAFPGRPVMLKWTRADEHGREPYTSPMIVELASDVDADGTITQWHHDVWSYTHLNRPMAGTDTSAYIAAQEIANGMSKPAEVPRYIRHIGEYRNADPLYALPNKQITSHFIPDAPFKVSSLRTLGAFANLFGIESFMDELAHAAGEDPIAYRLRHMQDERAIAVIKATAEHAGWQPRTTPSLSVSGHARVGRGFAFNQYKNIQSYCGMVVDVTVDDSGKITLDKVLMAVDSGEVINPDGLANQMEGGFVQAASWAMFEQVTFDASGVTSLDWDSYPILRFPDAPVIETVILDRPGYPFLGAGEASSGPVAAAIANAVFDATGKRLRDIPFSSYQTPS